MWGDKFCKVNLMVLKISTSMEECDLGIKCKFYDSEISSCKNLSTSIYRIHSWLFFFALREISWHWKGMEALKN